MNDGSDHLLSFEVCEAEIKWLDMSFNIDKSMVMRIGLRYDTVCAELKIGDKNLKYVSTIKYLGIFLKTSKVFSQDTHVLRSKFFRSLMVYTPSVVVKCRRLC